MNSPVVTTRLERVMPPSDEDVASHPAPIEAGRSVACAVQALEVTLEPGGADK